jgi:hypothetical protein
MTAHHRPLPLPDFFGKAAGAGVAAPQARQLALPLVPQRTLQKRVTTLCNLLSTDAEGKAMLTIDVSLPLGERWQAALRRRYRVHAAKTIAHDFGVEVRTAAAWLGGQPPYAKYLMKAWQLHGSAIIWEVLSPVEAEQPVETALENIERQLSALSSDLARLRGGGGG